MKSFCSVSVLLVSYKHNKKIWLTKNVKQKKKLSKLDVIMPMRQEMLSTLLKRKRMQPSEELMKLERRRVNKINLRQTLFQYKEGLTLKMGVASLLATPIFR